MNTLYQGDNLAILRSLSDASVDLICTDPPFNTGRDWGAFDDRWEGGLDGYLKFMKPRLIECRRVLKDTGSLYLHCDPTASHYLKVMLDSVFGVKQFRNEIVWKRQGGQSNHVKSKYSTEHDVILFYTKTGEYNFNLMYFPKKQSSIKRYDKVDSDGRRYKINNGSKRQTKPTKSYLDEFEGVALNSLWVENNFTLNASANERLDYPTQKPLALYARMIKASSNQGDVVLDPFAGSGTTLDAAESLGRKWIGIDIGDDAIEIIQNRLRDRHGLMLEYELKGALDDTLS